ncbi:MAG: hypothetical protein M1816_000474 [Peltula sp. TS41687]|nr:MAG: hypothetical protein M1816_000474 [Peltula sp. TS41687]
MAHSTNPARARSVVEDIAVTDLVEQVALAIPDHIRMPFRNAHMSLMEALVTALSRLGQESTLPHKLIPIDFRSRRSKRIIRARIKQSALDYVDWEKTMELAREYVFVDRPPPSAPSTLQSEPRRVEENQQDASRSTPQRATMSLSTNNELSRKRVLDNDNRPSPSESPQSRTHSQPLRVENQPSPTPQPASKSVEDAVRTLALADHHTTSRGPSLAPSHTGLAETHLPRLDMLLSVRGIDDILENSQSLGSVQAFVDTGAHVTTISADLLPSDPDGISCQVDFMIELPQVKNFTFNALASVVPRSSMPNQLSGALLGQCSFLDRMEFSLRPWRITKALQGGGILDDNNDTAVQKSQDQGWGDDRHQEMGGSGGEFN